MPAYECTPKLYGVRAWTAVAGSAEGSAPATPSYAARMRFGALGRPHR
jgi:hypothetical protein